MAWLLALQQRWFRSWQRQSLLQVQHSCSPPCLPARLFLYWMQQSLSCPQAWRRLPFFQLACWTVLLPLWFCLQPLSVFSRVSSLHLPLDHYQGCARETKLHRSASRFALDTSAYGRASSLIFFSITVLLTYLAILQGVESKAFHYNIWGQLTPLHKRRISPDWQFLPEPVA